MQEIILPSIGPICVASIALFISIFLMLIFIKITELPWIGWAALSSFSTFCYSAANFIQFNFTAGRYNLFTVLIQFTAIIFLIHSIYGFSLNYLRINTKKYHIYAGSFHVLLIIILWTTELIYTKNFITKDFLFLSRPFHAPQPGILSPYFFIYLIISVFIILVIWQKKKNVKDKSAYIFFSGILLWGILGAHDLLAVMGMKTVQYLMVYGFLGFSIALFIVIIGDYLEISRIAEEREQRLSEEKDLLATTLNSIADGVITTDSNVNIVLMNEAAEEITGWKWTEARGKNISEIFNLAGERDSKDNEDPVTTALKSKYMMEIAKDLTLISRDGNEKTIESSAATILNKYNKIIGIVLVFRDITEKQKITEALNRAKKIESVGLLAGGIAHDFNNILTAILGNLELAKAKSMDNTELIGILANSKKAALRAKDLTRQLLTFSKGGSPVKQYTSMNDLLIETTNFALSGSNVRCEFYLSREKWAVKIDTGQMSQVINNIIINAMEAMKNGGTIKVRTDYLLLDFNNDMNLKKGDYIKISIEDQGPGIPENIISRIFDPYFTTKEFGSGLGLATSYSIIMKHEGCIDIDTSAGHGATFIIYLPAVRERIKNEYQDDTKNPDGKGRILIMDDDESVRNVTSEMLKHFGYNISLAARGEEAIELFKKAIDENQPFDLVIMDLTVPGGMGGKDTIIELKKIDPGIKSIVSSGYSNKPVMSDYKKYGFSGVIIKPFEMEELIKIINQVLNQD